MIVTKQPQRNDYNGTFNSSAKKKRDAIEENVALNLDKILAVTRVKRIMMLITHLNQTIKIKLKIQMN